VSQKLNLFLEELALLPIQNHTRFFQGCQHLLDVRLMLLLARREDEDIVEVDDDEFVKEWRKDLVEAVLKSAWSPCEAERHHIPLIMTVPCSKRCLFFSKGV